MKDFQEDLEKAVGGGVCGGEGLEWEEEKRELKRRGFQLHIHAES